MLRTGSIKAVLAGLGFFLLAAFTLAPLASGADMLFWTAPDDGEILSMPLDGSESPSVLNVAPAEVDSDSQSLDPGSLDYDPATGRLYWLNTDSPANISWAAADGSGGGLLTSAIPDEIKPLRNLSLDGAAGRFYIRGGQGETIATIGLDGSPGAWALSDDNFRGGPLVDARSGTLWLAGPEWISYGNLNGSGSLSTYSPSAFMNGGFSVDRDAGRLYGTWYPGPDEPTEIAWMATDESGDGALVPTAVDPIAATSTAIDHDTGDLYWANGTPYGEIASTRGIFKVPLAGGAGAQVGTAQIGGRSGGLLILKAPEPTAPPGLTGGTEVGATLTCGEATWAGDRPEAHYFRSPVTESVSWTRDDDPIQGADEGTLVADRAGTYECTRSGTNAAGNGSSRSNRIVVTDPTPVCPAIKLSLQISKFAPPKPFGRHNAPGVRVTLRTSGRLVVSLQPKITFHGKEGSRVGQLRRHQFTVRGSRPVRFLLPHGLVRAIAKERGDVRSAPVTLTARATIWRPGSRQCAQHQNLKLRTKVKYVSSRPGIGLRRR